MRQKKEIVPFARFKYFTLRELLRNCSNEEIGECIVTGALDSLLVLLAILDEFRGQVQVPIYITSSYRNFAHNLRVGGSKTSQHMLGQAIDFYSTSLFWNEFVEEFLNFAKNAGFAHYLGQVIIHNNYIHFALSCTKHPKLQVYDERTSKKCY